MNNIPQWLKEGYFTPQDYEIDQIADFLERYPWEEVAKRPDLFNRILGEGEFSPATKIRMDRTFLLGNLINDIRKIPSQYYSSTLFRFVDTDTSDGGKGFENQLKEYWPEVSFKPNLNLPELKKRAKEIANGLNNLFKIALYRRAQAILTTIMVLKSKTPAELDQLLEKVRKVDTIVGDRLEKKEPMNKTMEGLAEIMEESGRTNLEINSIFSDTNAYAIRTKVIDVIDTMFESIAVIKQAQKDNLVTELDKIGIVSQELERYLQTDIEKFKRFVGINNPNAA